MMCMHCMQASLLAYVLVMDITGQREKLEGFITLAAVMV